MTPSPGGALSMFGAAADGNVWWLTQTAANAGTWSVRSQSFGRLGTRTTKVATVTSGTTGLMWVFCLSELGDVWLRKQQTVSTWTDWTTPLGSSHLTQIAAASNADGRMRVFGIDSDRRVVRTTQTAPGSLTWTGWAPMDNGQVRMTQIAACTNANGQIELFGLDHLGKVYSRHQTSVGSPASWTSWAVRQGQLRPDVLVPWSAVVTTPPPQPIIVPESGGMPFGTTLSQPPPGHTALSLPEPVSLNVDNGQS